MLRVDAEARHGGAGQAGAVRQLPHPADVTHGLLLQGGRRDLHVVLLVCRLDGRTHTRGSRGLLFVCLSVRGGRGSDEAPGGEATRQPHSPMKVLEMYSDTWLPERLISDRWDSSLFSILLNCGTADTSQCRHKTLFSTCI